VQAQVSVLALGRGCLPDGIDSAAHDGWVRQTIQDEHPEWLVSEMGRRVRREPVLALTHTM